MPGRRHAGPVPFLPTQAVGEGAREPGQGARPVHRWTWGQRGDGEVGDTQARPIWAPPVPWGLPVTGKEALPSQAPAGRPAGSSRGHERVCQAGGRPTRSSPTGWGFDSAQAGKPTGQRPGSVPERPEPWHGQALTQAPPSRGPGGPGSGLCSSAVPLPWPFTFPSAPGPVLLPGSFSRVPGWGSAERGAGNCQGWRAVLPVVAPWHRGSCHSRTQGAPRHLPFAVGEVSQQPSGPSEARAERAGGQAARAAGPGPQVPAGPCPPPPPAGPTARATACLLGTVPPMAPGAAHGHPRNLRGGTAMSPFFRARGRGPG